MSNLRPTTEHQRRQLKAAVRRLMELAGGSSSFEHVTRVKAPALSKYGSLDDEKHMPLDVAMDLMLDTGSNGILSVMAAMLGLKLVALDGQHFNGALPCIADVVKVTKSASDVVQEYAQAIDDGVVTRHEKKQIDFAIEQAVQTLRSFQRKIDAATSQGGAA